MRDGQPLSVYWRCYVYALHGYASEIMFTAIWEFVVHFNWKLPGNTSIWIMPVYGLSGLIMEKIYIGLVERQVPFLVRGVIYLLWTYTWEFSTGFLLKQFDVCPWDYTAFDGDFMGLITLEYAPLWFVGGLITEKFIMRYTRQLYWGPTHHDFVPNHIRKGD